MEKNDVKNIYTKVQSGKIEQRLGDAPNLSEGTPVPAVEYRRRTKKERLLFGGLSGRVRT